MGIVNWLGNTQLLLWFFASIGVCPDFHSYCGTSMTMYNKSVRCGNLIASQEQLNPMVFWWGMKEVSRVGNHGEGNLEDSWRTNTLPMPTGLAPPKHHGVFLFSSDRTPHDSKTSTWGRGRKGYSV